MSGLTEDPVPVVDAYTRRVEILTDLALAAACAGVAVWRSAAGLTDWRGVLFMSLPMAAAATASKLARGRPLWLQLAVPLAVMGLILGAMTWSRWPGGRFDEWSLGLGLVLGHCLGSAVGRLLSPRGWGSVSSGGHPSVTPIA
jgi:hypothetical protein